MRKIVLMKWDHILSTLWIAYHQSHKIILWVSQKLFLSRIKFTNQKEKISSVILILLHFSFRNLFEKSVNSKIPSVWYSKWINDIPLEKTLRHTWTALLRFSSAVHRQSSQCHCCLQYFPENHLINLSNSLSIDYFSDSLRNVGSEDERRYFVLVVLLLVDRGDFAQHIVQFLLLQMDLWIRVRSHEFTLAWNKTIQE